MLPSLLYARIQVYLDALRRTHIYCYKIYQFEIVHLVSNVLVLQLIIRVLPSIKVLFV